MYNEIYSYGSTVFDNRPSDEDRCHVTSIVLSAAAAIERMGHTRLSVEHIVDPELERKTESRGLYLDPQFRVARAKAADIVAKFLVLVDLDPEIAADMLRVLDIMADEDVVKVTDVVTTWSPYSRLCPACCTPIHLYDCLLPLVHGSIWFL